MKLALSSHLFLVNASKMQYDAIQAQQRKMVRRVKALNVLETQTPGLEPRLKPCDNINISSDNETSKPQARQMILYLLCFPMTELIMQTRITALTPCSRLLQTVGTRSNTTKALHTALSSRTRTKTAMCDIDIHRNTADDMVSDKLPSSFEIGI